jgi:transcriptional regulator with XRE-family HTH domain
MAGADTDTHQYLRAWRKRRNKTLEKVSEDVRSKVNTISGWENGKRRVNLDDLCRLAAIYEVSVADLLQSPESYDQRQSSDRFVLVANRLSPDQAEHLIWIAEQMAPPPHRTDPPPLPRPKGPDPPRPITGGHVTENRIGRDARATRGPCDLTWEAEGDRR